MSKSRRVSSRENEQDTDSRAKKIRKIMISFQLQRSSLLHQHSLPSTMRMRV